VLTKAAFCAIFFPVKSYDKDNSKPQAAQRGIYHGARILHPLGLFTTLELTAGNDSPGMPVIAHAMSGGLVRNQGGTVEYIIYYVSHP